jgi:hypothetical protein
MRILSENRYALFGVRMKRFHGYEERNIYGTFRSRFQRARERLRSKLASYPRP